MMQCGTTELVFWAISAALLITLVVVGVLQLVKKEKTNDPTPTPPHLRSVNADTAASARRAAVSKEPHALHEAFESADKKADGGAGKHVTFSEAENIASFFANTDHGDFDKQFTKHDKEELRKKLSGSASETRRRFTELDRRNTLSRSVGVDVISALRQTAALPSSVGLTATKDFMNLSDARWQAMQPTTE